MNKTLQLQDTELWEKNTQLIQPVYMKDILTSEWKMGNVLCWGKGYVCFHRKRKTMNFFQVEKKIRFERGRPPENLGCRQEKEIKKNEEEEYNNGDEDNEERAVSYTHLTLPTNSLV